MIYATSVHSKKKIYYFFTSFLKHEVICVVSSENQTFNCEFAFKDSSYFTVEWGSFSLLLLFERFQWVLHRLGR